MKKILYSLIVSMILPAVIFVTIPNANAKSNISDWTEDKMEDINDDYNEAVKKINNSSFTTEQKSVLSAQATANRDLAVSQTKAVAAQMQKNRAERESFKDSIKNSRENRKAVKEVDDIL